MQLKGSKTEDHLKAALPVIAGKPRYLYFAAKAMWRLQRRCCGVPSMLKVKPATRTATFEYLEKCGDPQPVCLLARLPIT